MPSESADGNNTAMSDFCAEFDIEKDLFLFLFFFLWQCKTEYCYSTQDAYLKSNSNKSARIRAFDDYLWSKGGDIS